jgi:hypothetical protein
MAPRVNATTPHFAHPFGRDDSGRVAVVEQGFPPHILACETRIVMCPQGFRFDRPDFGIPWPFMREVPIDTVGVEIALRRLEPRGRAKVSEHADAIDQAVRRINIDVEVEP